MEGAKDPKVSNKIQIGSQLTDSDRVRVFYHHVSTKLAIDVLTQSSAISRILLLIIGWCTSVPVRMSDWRVPF